MYGFPSAAGGIERPITPATAISVSTYGSAENSTAAGTPQPHVVEAERATREADRQRAERDGHRDREASVE